MLKVQILTECKNCQGDAYLPVGTEVSYSGEAYMRFEPCPVCQGSGSFARWITLQEFLDLLEVEAVKDPMQVDNAELAKQRPVSQYQESRDAAGI